MPTPIQETFKAALYRRMFNGSAKHGQERDDPTRER